ncbi:flavodoxin family protein [Cucumibacter marinus]|uniref:flavodoxin family protein n=1 Tax=Cucumibacter marinus TaxID=1121252 RepID=UPI000408E486|nr:hypothetical protein [Cucumibacter marinus]
MTILTIIAIIVVLVALALAGLFWAITRERPRSLRTLAEDGKSGRALIVCHPGLSAYPERIAKGFALGLQRNGWAVDQITPSRKAGTGLERYDLLVLVAPIYMDRAARPLTRFLARLGALKGNKLALLLTGAGTTDPAMRRLSNAVDTAGGEIVFKQAYTVLRPNEPDEPIEGSNTDIGVEMATRAGAALQLER